MKERGEEWWTDKWESTLDGKLDLQYTWPTVHLTIDKVSMDATIAPELISFTVFSSSWGEDTLYFIVFLQYTLYYQWTL